MSTALMSFYSPHNGYSSRNFQQMRTTETLTDDSQVDWLAKTCKPALRSTLAAAIRFVMIPTCAIASTTPTNPTIANIAAQDQEKLALAVYQFEFVSTERDIFNFLRDNHDASSLLEAWSSISNAVFERGLPSKLEVILDIEANEKVLIIEINTKIEDEEVFHKAEERLFKLIEMRHLECSLEHVVLSLY